MTNRIMVTINIAPILRRLLGDDAGFAILVAQIQDVRVESELVGINRESSIQIAADLLGLDRYETKAILNRIRTKLGAK